MMAMSRSRAEIYARSEWRYRASGIDGFRIRSGRGVTSDAHQRYSLRHEHLDPGGLSRDGAKSDFTSHWECRGAFEHWPDVRWNSSRILRPFCDELVKLTETGAPAVGNQISYGRRNRAAKWRQLRSL